MYSNYIYAYLEENQTPDVKDKKVMMICKTWSQASGMSEMALISQIDYIKILTKKHWASVKTEGCIISTQIFFYCVCKTKEGKVKKSQPNFIQEFLPIWHIL